VGEEDRGRSFIRRLRPFLDEHENVRILDFDYDVRLPDRAPPA
jgi:hypothetical protein